MGTDIHLEVEVNKADRWERLPHLPQPCTSCATYNRETDEYEEPKGFIYPWINEDEVESYLARGFSVLDRRNNGRVQISEQRECWHCHGSKIVYPQIYHDRNYDVFAVLANVRNGFGFAGIVTGEPMTVIAEPRGLPADMSQELVDHLARLSQDDGDDLYEKMEAEPEGYWWLGEHSFSWLTLREILEFDWSQMKTNYGWVDPWNFELFRRTGKPKAYSGGVSGALIEHVHASAMAQMIDEREIVFEGDDEDWLNPPVFTERPYTTGLQRAMADWPLPEGSTGAMIRDKVRYYCPIEWQQPYLDSLKHFKQRMEELVEHAPDGDLDRIRIVFGFDS